MREFLTGLYIEHGDRAWRKNYALSDDHYFWYSRKAKQEGFIKEERDFDIMSGPIQKLTHKAIEYIKNLDNP